MPGTYDLGDYYAVTVSAGAEVGHNEWTARGSIFRRDRPSKIGKTVVGKGADRLTAERNAKNIAEVEVMNFPRPPKNWKDSK
ncbi:MAG: hypothetical protein HOB18_13200 [Nitrospina sp.]|jgi:hypothetical protein|nr:hypothetical protein [Nitrospina sp.]